MTQNVVCGTAVGTSPKNLLEMVNLRPTPDLLSQNLHLTDSLGDSCAH